MISLELIQLGDSAGAQAEGRLGSWNGYRIPSTAGERVKRVLERSYRVSRTYPAMACVLDDIAIYPRRVRPVNGVSRC